MRSMSTSDIYIKIRIYDSVASGGNFKDVIGTFDLVFSRKQKHSFKLEDYYICENKIVRDHAQTDYEIIDDNELSRYNHIHKINTSNIKKVHEVFRKDINRKTWENIYKQNLNIHAQALLSQSSTIFNKILIDYIKDILIKEKLI